MPLISSFNNCAYHGTASIFIVQGHGPVGVQPLDSRNRQGDIACRLIARQQQFGHQPRHLDLAGLGAVADGIAHLDHAPSVACARWFGMGGVDGGGPCCLRWDGDMDKARFGLGLHRHRRNLVRAIRHRQKRAIRQKPFGLRDRDLSGIKSHRIEIKREEAEGRLRLCGEGVPHQPADVPVLLLQVLGTQEKPLRPDDLVSIGHNRPFRSFRPVRATGHPRPR